MAPNELYQRLHDLHRSISTDPLLPPELQEEIERLKMAPFAATPEVTLASAPLLVVSMKPYGDGRTTYPFGWEERRAKPGLHRWYDGGRAGGNFVREADKLLQYVLQEMGCDLPPRAVPNTYAYFFRAADARQLKAFGLERVDCGAFHRVILAAVDPRVVLCIGNGPEPSAFALYKRLLAPEEVQEHTPAARIKIRWFRAAGRLVVGVPHLSYVRAEVLLPAISAILGNET